MSIAKMNAGPHPLLTVIFRKVVDQMRVHDFLLQQINLVEEQDDRGLFEPLVGDDCPEQGHALLHAILQKENIVK